jgi:hypothetical protein
VLRRIFGLEREEVSGSCKRLRMRSFIDVGSTKFYQGQIKEVEMGGANSTHGRN